MIIFIAQGNIENLQATFPIFTESCEHATVSKYWDKGVWISAIWHLELRISFVLMHLHAFVWQALLQATGNSGGKPGEKLWWSRLSHLHISCWSFHAWCLSPMLRPMFKDQHIEKLLNRNISEIGATLHQFSHNLPIWLYVQNCEGSCQINNYLPGWTSPPRCSVQPASPPWSALVKNGLFLDAAPCISEIFLLKEVLCLSTISRLVKLPKFVDASILIALMEGWL